VPAVSETKPPANAPGVEFDPEQLRGMKQLRRVSALLSFLHEVGCGRDRAGNRGLHFDDYVLLVLLYLFNPMIDSMRTLQKVADLPEVRQRLGIKRFSLGSFSESCRVFEPAMLRGVVDQLAAGLRPVGRDELLKQLPGTLTLVDSTVIDTLCTVAEAMYLPLGGGRHSHAWRLHLHLDVDRHVPAAWELTDPRNTGKSDEKSVLRRSLSAGHTYVMDRWGTPAEYRRGPLRPVHALERRQGRRQQLRLPGARQQRLRRAAGAPAGPGGRRRGRAERPSRPDRPVQEAG